MLSSIACCSRVALFVKRGGVMRLDSVATPWREGAAQNAPTVCTKAQSTGTGISSMNLVRTASLVG